MKVIITLDLYYAASPATIKTVVKEKLHKLIEDDPVIFAFLRGYTIEVQP